MKNVLLMCFTMSALLCNTITGSAQNPVNEPAQIKGIKTDKALPVQMTGKVTAVNPEEKTVTVLVNGKEAILYSPKATRLPAVGSELVFTADKRYPLYANCEQCNSDCSNDCVSGVCFMTVDFGCKCYIIADWFCGMR